MAKKILPIILIFLVFLFLYFPVLGVYFSGDDFFHFKASLTDGSLGGFLKLFGVYPINIRGYAFYRPVFREALYNIFYLSFGLNHLPFRILQFVIHFTNITLVYLLFERLIKNKFVSLFTSFFFAISAANVGSLYYLAGGIQAQGALMFVLFSLLFFEKKFVSFIFFVLGLMSHELAVITPVLLAGLTFMGEKKLRLKDYLYLIPHALLLFSYLYLNFRVIGFSSGEAQYKMNFNSKTLLNTLSWYGVWALGLPEMLVDYVGSGLNINPNLMKFWGSYFRIIFPAFFISCALLLMVVVLGVWKDKRFLKNKKPLFLLGWFFVGLLPVLFLPVHKKTYYLQISLPAFWGMLGFMVSKSKSKFLKVSLSISLFILSVASIRLADKTYPYAQRGRIAQELVKDFSAQYPSLPKGATIFVKNDSNYPSLSGDWKGSSNQAYFILNGNDALQLLYNDPSLKVYYEDRDQVSIDPKMLIFTAKIN